VLRLIIISLFTFTILASDGVVLFVKGGASIGKVALKKGSEVSFNSTITTDKNSLIVIKFTDGTTIKVNGDSEVFLKSFSNGASGTEISVRKGSSFFNYIKRKIVKDSIPLRVTTRTASMGVRGTTFFVAVNEIKNNTDTWMCVKEGIVSSTSLSTKQTKDVKAGEGIKISSNDRLTAPRFLPWTKALNWKLDGQEGLENNLDIKEAYEDILTIDYE